MIMNMIKKIINKIKNEIVNSLWFLIVKVVVNICFSIEYTYLLWKQYGMTSSAGFICLAILWGMIMVYCIVRLVLDILGIVSKVKK